MKNFVKRKKVNSITSVLIFTLYGINLGTVSAIL